MSNVDQFDVVVGAGGAGFMAGMYASKTAKTALISKLYLTRSHIRKCWRISRQTSQHPCPCSGCLFCGASSTLS
jgi:hypothetical protein